MSKSFYKISHFAGDAPPFLMSNNLCRVRFPTFNDSVRLRNTRTPFQAGPTRMILTRSFRQHNQLRTSSPCVENFGRVYLGVSDAFLKITLYSGIDGRSVWRGEESLESGPWDNWRLIVDKPLGRGAVSPIGIGAGSRFFTMR